MGQIKVRAQTTGGSATNPKDFAFFFNGVKIGGIGTSGSDNTDYASAIIDNAQAMAPGRSARAAWAATASTLSPPQCKLLPFCPKKAPKVQLTHAAVALHRADLLVQRGGTTGRKLRQKALSLHPYRSINVDYGDSALN